MLLIALSPLHWSGSYLTERTQIVVQFEDDSRTPGFSIDLASTEQRSVLGPLWHIFISVTAEKARAPKRVLIFRSLRGGTCRVLGQFVAGQFVADNSSRTIRRKTIRRGQFVAK